MMVIGYEGIECHLCGLTLIEEWEYNNELCYSCLDKDKAESQIAEQKEDPAT